MPIISIEACIGSGKSTLLDLLKNKYSNNNKVVFVPEPVDKWLETRDETGKDILATFYEDKKRWGYSFQMNAFITRCKSIIAENDNNDKLIILERSIYTDKHVFANYLHQCGDIGLLEINLYNEWFEWLSSKFPVTPSHYIYLKCDTNVAYQRVIKRCREAEMGHIPLEYLEAINDKHDKWLTTLDNVSIIDVNNDFQYDQNNRDTILNNVSLIIDSHISKLA